MGKKIVRKVSNKKDKFKGAEKQSSNSGLIIGAIIAIGILAIGAFIVISGSSGNGGGTGLDIARRYLPQGYELQKVSEPVDYASIGQVEMTDTEGKKSGEYFELSLNDVLKNKLVLAKYEDKQVTSNAGQTGLPIMAYIKPSGKLFVGVSFCPPCNGIKHTIMPDGTLSCNTCGTIRDLETDEGISGACRLYPSDELPVEISGDKVKIPVSVLDNWTAQEVDPSTRPVGG